MFLYAAPPILVVEAKLREFRKNLLWSPWVSGFTRCYNGAKLPAGGERMASETSTGTLSDSRTVVLDHPLALPLGRVRVVVEALSVPATEHSWLEKLEEIRQALRQSDYHFRSRKEIDAQIQRERDNCNHA
jgi:hypothetical protein